MQRRRQDAGFVTLTTVSICLICFLVVGFVVHETWLHTRSAWQFEQTKQADLLAQDGLQIAKQLLSQDPKWRGSSQWISRTLGSCQYKIQSNPESPLSTFIQVQYPNGVMIQSTGKTQDASVRVIDIWYIPSINKVVALEYV